MPIGEGGPDGCQRVVVADQAGGLAARFLDGGEGWSTFTGSPDSDNGGLIESADATGGVDLTIDDPDPSGSAPQLTDLVISVDTAMTVTIVDTQTPTPYRYFKFFMAANSTLQVTLRGSMGSCGVGKKFQAIASVAGNIAITCKYRATNEFA